MDKLFPHSEYPEDQEHSKTILTIHVLRSGLAAGSILSVLSGTLTTLYKEPSALLSSRHANRLLIHASRGSIAGFLISGVMLTTTMWGKEDIEWQDRAWLLLGSEGQCEFDKWLAAGGVLGGLGAMALGKGRTAASAATAINKKPAIVVKPLEAITGGISLGTASGAAGCIAWRIGVHGSFF
ncbi:hypothetical protein H112_01814 [Trichophyton rubrum D6]|uniref:Uncharacterized protein n=4 Tax=Trichophyton TaxID=5550 RepID=A0A178F0Q5_TRIRU|nr:uncharacterized protein TERG_06584 [Trichophyton rubrum CBS 118892]EZF26009.1 hypothetical protein H100_01810 [Trichophyton rubrum MR850]EZF45003.1 hypothetical protein H102_01805 [Trichophyton rubrum CBS 100081]EZF55658.1 hypothetical protein H103_01815 [Trichophyton rubrum CBS 288.86]EZF66322.1 hypothetical protein H104_01792 [Trichophyton rubrum CBS 289.86]EZF76870.1 hypothetical protein H105_01819 [Trichophyton soudanense CBS 452.61]EZF87640.1 hypothetical protein H110_01816 [Trichophy